MGKIAETVLQMSGRSSLHTVTGGSHKVSAQAEEARTEGSNSAWVHLLQQSKDMGVWKGVIPDGDGSRRKAGASGLGNILILDLGVGECLLDVFHL